MVEKLKSLLRAPKLKLGAKALIVAGSLYLLPFWQAALIAAFFYFYPAVNTYRLLTSFLISLYLGFIFSEAIMPATDFWLSATILFYLLLGIKDILFIRRKEVYFWLNNFISVLIFASAFLKEISFLSMVVLLYLIYQEFWQIESPGFINRQKLFVATSVLVASELFWALSTIDLKRKIAEGFYLSGANSSLLAGLEVASLMALVLSGSKKHFEGRLTTKVIIIYLVLIAFFGFLTLSLTF